MPDTSAQAYHHAREVKERIARDVMRIPGVLSIGVGRTAEQQPCLVIKTDVRAPDAQARLDRALEALNLDVPVMTCVGGPIRAL